MRSAIRRITQLIINNVSLEKRKAISKPIIIAISERGTIKLTIPIKSDNAEIEEPIVFMLELETPKVGTFIETKEETQFNKSDIKVENI